LWKGHSLFESEFSTESDLFGFQYPLSCKVIQ
jgi:hypothetical protein